MKDIIEKVLAYLPQYFAELGEVCTTPKRFIAERDVNSDETFAASLLFLAISLVLQTLIWAPLNPSGRDLWTELGSVAVFTMMDVTLGALAIYIAWWIVGSRARAKGFFTSFSYFSGAPMVIGAGFGLFEWSIVKVFEPERFEKLFVRRPGSEQIKMMFDSEYATRIIGEPSAAWYMVAGLHWAFIFLFLGWIIVAWGAFRKLSGLSKIRSFFAFLFAAIFSVVGIYAVIFVQAAFG
jgi:hypothetical protein